VSGATVRLFTDPACPPHPEWERLRRCDDLRFEVRMAVLRERRLRPWPHTPGSDATIHACRAVVAAGLRWPDRQEALLRELQALSAAGEPLDDSDTLEIAAERAGLQVAELAAYCAEPEVEAALRADMAAASGRECPSVEIVGALPERCAR
jgi:protein-disulfide isomerase-like protein with CxxC motif